MVPNIFMADLRYNYCGVLANDCMPLGVAYMKAVMDRDLPGDVCSRLFTYPDKLLEEIDGEVREIFLHAGGENFAHIPCLNDSPEGMAVIETMVRRDLQGWA